MLSELGQLLVHNLRDLILMGWEQRVEFGSSEDQVSVGIYPVSRDSGI